MQLSDRTFRDVLKELDADAQSTIEKGTSFERLVKAFLEHDKVQSDRFARVWPWSDWPGNGGRHDTGIDLVAEEQNGGDLVAIQCKFYGEDNSIALEQLNKFLTAYGEVQFSSGIMVATTDKWTREANDAIQAAHTKPVTRWGPDIFENSSIDWSVFDLNNPSGAARKPTKTLRGYQQEALDAVNPAGFNENLALAFALSGSSDNEEAIAALLKIDGERDEVFCRCLGHFQILVGDSDSAVANLQEAVNKTKPAKRPKILALYGAALLGQGNDKQALDTFNSASEARNPGRTYKADDELAFALSISGPVKRCRAYRRSRPSPRSIGI